ncbi:MAG: DUF5605 domain-containing protein [Candidatus Limivivens sp.]|nr:DUF5605 domain-containing protein [Candidatus Limivivens sp.]
MRQYEVCELTFEGKQLEADFVHCRMQAEITGGGDCVSVKAFYAGEGKYKVRFLPKQPGLYDWKLTGGSEYDIREEAGQIQVEKAGEDAHGMVLAGNHHFRYEDGTPYYPFGTTVYALSHQDAATTEDTFASLADAPFNKVRMCVFPKDYRYNKNEPPFYAFEKTEDGRWDVNRPCFAFWDNLEEDIARLGKMGIQADLILFHPYDRWGFSRLTMEENRTYLDYLLRRLAAFPNIWWSMANEYDLCLAVKSLEDWEVLEEYTAANDPYHHLLSNHNCFVAWDFSRKNVTHVSYQTKRLGDVPMLYEKYQKPVVIDECCYEGNLPEFWGSISGREMTARFWRVMTSGGYCTHGETFLDPEKDVVWWAKGGKLKGESPARIQFLKDLIYSLPSPLEPLVDGMLGLVNLPPEQRGDLSGKGIMFQSLLMAVERMTPEEKQVFFALEYCYKGHCGEDAYLYYYDTRTNALDTLSLPEDKTYRIELIDTWAMTRETILERASGTVTVSLPGREWMAVLATRISE